MWLEQSWTLTTDGWTSDQPRIQVRHRVDPDLRIAVTPTPADWAQLCRLVADLHIQAVTG